MALPSLPNDIVCNIILRVSLCDYSHLGPFLRAVKASKEMVKRDEVQYNCKLWSLGQTEHIHPSGLARPFFEKCLAKDNLQASYLEGLRLCARGEDLHGGIHLLDKVVPYNASATLSSSIFSVCIGDQIKASKTFHLLPKHGVNLNSRKIWKLEDKLQTELWWFNPSYHNTFIKTWIYPEDDVIDIPDCVEDGHANDREICKECRLFYVTRTISKLL